MRSHSMTKSDSSRIQSSQVIKMLLHDFFRARPTYFSRLDLVVTCHQKDLLPVLSQPVIDLSLRTLQIPESATPLQNPLKTVCIQVIKQRVQILQRETEGRFWSIELSPIARKKSGEGNWSKSGKGQGSKLSRTVGIYRVSGRLNTDKIEFQVCIWK